MAVAGEVLDVLIEEAGLDAVNRLGVGKMIDKIDESRRDGNLAQHFAFVPAGDGRDLGQVLRLQGDGLGGQLLPNFIRQRLGQFAPAGPAPR